eukprot:g65563.t1
MCVNKISDEETKRLDLSGLHTLILGAERIRASALRDFAKKFKPQGFREEVFVPAYGLAENGLQATCKQGLDKPPKILCVDTRALAQGEVRVSSEAGSTHASIELVACGEAAAFSLPTAALKNGQGASLATSNGGHNNGKGKDNASVSNGKERKAVSESYGKEKKECEQQVLGPSTVALVVDPDTCRACPDGTVGEIWLAGRSKTAGYFGKPELSQEVFEAKLSDAEILGEQAAAYKSLSWLRTGDLGAIYEGQLYVTGRRKEIIILHGASYYPQDIEAAIRSSAHPLVRPGYIAAFAITLGDQEHVCVLVELRDPPTYLPVRLFRTATQGVKSLALQALPRSLLTQAPVLATSLQPVVAALSTYSQAVQAAYMLLGAGVAKCTARVRQRLQLTQQEPKQTALPKQTAPPKQTAQPK